MWYIKIGDKMKQKNINIDEFLIALDNLIASKYILAERKISDVLLQVARSADVYNLIAQCMINFDFKAEWKVATSAHFFKLPDTDEQRVAFIFCLLSKENRFFKIRNSIFKIFPGKFPKLFQQN